MHAGQGCYCIIEKCGVLMFVFFFICSGAHSSIASSSNSGKSSASAEYGDYIDPQGSSVRSNDDALRLMSSGEEISFDEGDDSDIANVDDLVAKMDLTDDLLHMVFTICCCCNGLKIGSLSLPVPLVI